MPVLDMPVAQLKQYMGTNPIPADFDDYWKRGLDEVYSTPVNTQITPADLNSRSCDVYDLYFDSVKGARIYAKYIRRKDLTEKAPVVLLFHGYSGSSGDYFDKIAYASEGYIVLAMDCRGQGGRSRDSVSIEGTTHGGQIIRGVDDPDPDKLYFRNVYLDTVQLMRVAKTLPLCDPDKIYAAGGSQGGGLTVACAALCGNDIKKAAPTFPFLSDYKRVFEMDLLKDAYGELTYYIKLFAYTEEMQVKFWQRLGYIDIQHLAGRITAATLWGTGLLDSVCPPSTQFAAYNKISADKEMIIYTNHGHEWLPGFGDKTLSFFNG